jgi:hypothetical protein
MIFSKIGLNSVKVAAFISLLTFGFGAPVLADEDLTNSETCFDCHDDTDRAPPSDPTRPQVHKPTGGVFVEDHESFDCIDCHTYIENLEHEETAPDMEVDCLECHDEVPAKE